MMDQYCKYFPHIFLHVLCVSLTHILKMEKMENTKTFCQCKFLLISFDGLLCQILECYKTTSIQIRYISDHISWVTILRLQNLVILWKMFPDKSFEILRQLFSPSSSNLKHVKFFQINEVFLSFKELKILKIQKFQNFSFHCLKAFA